MFPAFYNGLVAVWSELPNQAAAIHKMPGDWQGDLDFWRKSYFFATCIPSPHEGKYPAPGAPDGSTRCQAFDPPQRRRLRSKAVGPIGMGGEQAQQAGTRPQAREQGYQSRTSQR